jgi:tetratricopeptide (TPR) repeat protein
LWPHSALAYVRLGETYEAFGDIDQAISCYEYAISVDPEFADSYVELGQILFDKKGMGDEAVELYEQALALDDRNTAAHRLLLTLYRQQRDWFRLSELVAQYQADAQAHPNSVAAWIALATAYEWLDHFGDALTAYQRVVALDPTYAAGYRRIALLQWSRSEVMKAWGQYLALQPTGEAAQEALAQLASLRRVEILSPADGTTVQGIVQVQGLADMDNFLFYKVEWGVGESPTEWHVITLAEQPVVTAGVLTEWDTAALEPGIYKLRLTTVDTTGNYPPWSEISVRVLN